MKTFEIDVIQTVRVTLDETKFTDDFMEEFRQHFYACDDLEDHAQHIAQLQARGVIDLTCTGEFIEGYGPSVDMGITAEVIASEIHSEGDRW